MLERITDFMSHPELIIKANQLEDPVERFVSVTAISCQAGTLSPRRTFPCKMGIRRRYRGILCGRTISHHPPISVYYYASPENNLRIVGDLLPKSKFLGNSAATLMQGEINVSFTNRPGEEYLITMPNVYARGILFGTMLMELGDVATVKCSKLDLICSLEFKVKGYFTGSYNGISGKIKRISTGEVLYEISGKWSNEIYISKKGNNKEVYFDVKTARIHPKIVAPEDQQEWNESRRLWSKLTAALKVNNQSLATEEKSKVEDAQRLKSREREEKGTTHVSRYFEPNGDGFDLRLKNISSDPQVAKSQIENFIFNTPAPPS
ncbi:hypothetical protein BCR41DRAFT_356843 [Lobosporangium transversale]|uniref:Oxysterol-binding protein n=1 Tax=Lobosporangium transversale TaxID=64571 RepID=A0A1Y2GI92_9FUNG|nr:hypothetical protein BCR41DRAFT_356843 [Lobosporangium transversale]ORZ11732.1 hypothetical protein BCR41DRAFT_356843 [Lobosporangium transversale]|eukprot:XP_021879829.1 hypothetical protein BCR41DRAFT_356843 [Lobosporangium transversale]